MSRVVGACNEIEVQNHKNLVEVVDAEHSTHGTLPKKTLGSGSPIGNGELGNEVAGSKPVWVGEKKQKGSFGSSGQSEAERVNGEAVEHVPQSCLPQFEEVN